MPHQWCSWSTAARLERPFTPHQKKIMWCGIACAWQGIAAPALPPLQEGELAKERESFAAQQQALQSQVRCTAHPTMGGALQWGRSCSPRPGPNCWVAGFLGAGVACFVINYVALRASGTATSCKLVDASAPAMRGLLSERQPPCALTVPSLWRLAV